MKNEFSIFKVSFITLLIIGQLGLKSNDQIKSINARLNNSSQKSLYLYQEIIKEIDATMVMITGGTFTMGCTEEQGSDCREKEKPPHEVTVNDFQINKFEVTQEQWEAIMDSNPSYYKNCGRCPVELVNWYDTQEFIAKLNSITGSNYRLPTEAEWEYAARGGEHYKYAGSNCIDSVAWYGDNRLTKTQIIGGKAANGYGLYDMSGNVWEWVSGWYEQYNSIRRVDPNSASGHSRLFRGGSFVETARDCRVSHRQSSSPEKRDLNIGFRLAR